ncbi:MAG: hypothetical protein HC824_13195 [Synechococcales cyanobacterium RM1_1_8]|nr:hypothetical protein [Synechococcales cyanobacterium RM1_1_8]
MDETMPDAQPLTQQFLASLAQFMAQEHQPEGPGDISAQVKVAIASSASESEAQAGSPAEGGQDLAQP